ncbi:MAG: hypothetical protein MUO26_07820 [Methanotrichaceae archaeon]|nr:hypothetical protein [Methanotrichaceae archaeon]
MIETEGSVIFRGCSNKITKWTVTTSNYAKFAFDQQATCSSSLLYLVILLMADRFHP